MSDYSVHDEDGFSRDYTEDSKVKVRKGDLRALLDVATMSMDFGSGMLVEEQVEALRKIAEVLGLDPVIATPANFVCKYRGEHSWPEGAFILDYQPPPNVPRESPELTAAVAALALAKQAVHDNRNDETQSALESAKQKVTELRSERRNLVNEDQATWSRTTRGGTRPLQSCEFCHQRRAAPVLWQQSFDRGEYDAEVVRLDRTGGVLTLYRIVDRVESVVAQRRVALNAGELDLDDEDDWMTRSIEWISDLDQGVEVEPFDVPG